MRVNATAIPFPIEVNITPYDAIEALCKEFGFDARTYSEIKIEKNVLVRYTEIGEHSEDREIISSNPHIIAMYKAIMDLKKAYGAYEKNLQH